MRIRDATIVVTGASGGIGRATAIACADRGANVVLAARDAGTLEEAAEECRRAGGRALAVPTDVADQDAVSHLAARAVERFGGIDAWVNDAAVMAYGRFEDTPAHIHRRVLETNLLGQIHGARAALPVFRRRGAGVLVNVASLYGTMTSPFVSSYVVSKYGVMGFSEVLRQELRAAGRIRVATVLPGSIDTPIFRHAADFTGRRPRPVPPVSSPDRAVRAILRAIRWPRRQVRVGWAHRVFALGHTLFPRLYAFLAPPAMRIVGLSAEESDETPGNVLEPMPEWNTVRGGWRHPWRRAAAAVVTAGAVLAWRGARR